MAGASIGTKPTAVRSFLDTHVLVYADVGDEPARQTRALALHALRGFSFYDTLIAQATVTSGYAQLLTEDMQTGAVVGGMRIVNPFAG